MRSRSSAWCDRVDWINPHMLFLLEVQQEDGTTIEFPEDRWMSVTDALKK